MSNLRVSTLESLGTGDVFEIDKLVLRQDLESFAGSSRIGGQAVSVAKFGVKGNGDDETLLIQHAVDTCVAAGDSIYFPKPPVYYRIEDNIIVSNAENIKITCDKNAKFYTSGDFEGVEIWPSMPESDFQVAKHRCFFAIVDSKNVEFEGGIFDGGSSVLAGFEHKVGNAATAILSLRCENVSVRATQCLNIAPEGVWGSKSDNGYYYRYTAILGILCKGFYAIRNHIDTVAYSGIESRIGCEDTKVLYNYVTNAGAHLTQSTSDYGPIAPSFFGEYGFNRGVIVHGNTGRGARTDITCHSEMTEITGNTLIDVTDNKTISIRAGSDGVIVTGNTAICTEAKGDTAFDIQQPAQNVSVYGNVAKNYVKAYNNAGGAFIGHNELIECDDAGANYTGYGVRAGQDNQQTQSVHFGYEAGCLGSGATDTYVGYRAGREAVGNNNVYLGTTAGYKATGGNNVGIGRSAVSGASGSNIVAAGLEAGFNSTGTDCVFMGHRAGKGNTGDRAFLFGDVQDNSYRSVIAFGNSPTAAAQLQVGKRHIEIEDVEFPPVTPELGRARLYLRTVGGVQTLAVRFSNGALVTIATDGN